jgi:iron complex outermembrane receptor protein
MKQLPLIALMTGLWGASSISAQTQDDHSSTTQLPEIKVISGLLEQRQFDAPGSVQSVPEARIRASGPQVNLSDVLADVPGVVALNRNNYAQDVQISIRGFGARAAFGLRGIRLYADGIPASTPDGQGQASTISMTSADRVEVLTGPLAQIYGNASGGVIQTFTREAGDKAEVRSQLFTGSYGLRRTDWQFSDRTGNVGVVADYSTFSTNGYRQNSAARREQLNTVVTLDSAPGTRHKFIANLFDMPLAQDPLGLTATQLATPNTAGTNAVNDGARKGVHQEQLGWVMNHQIEGDLKLNTRFYRGDRSNLQYQAGTGTTPSTAPNGTWVGLQRQYYGLGADLQGQREGEIPMQWIAGLAADKSAEQRQGGTSISGQPTNVLTRNEWDIGNTTDVFAQANWLLSEHYTLVTGARHTEAQLNVNNLFNPALTGPSQSHFSANNPVLGLTWHATPTLNVYANMGRGFETPTLAEVAYSNVAGRPVNQFNPLLQAATSQHQEVGVKYADGRGTKLNLALFQITTHNEIVTELNSTGQTTYKNASLTHRQGIELNWAQSWNRNVLSNVSLNVMQAQFGQGYSYTSNGSPIVVNSGNSLPATPNRLGYAGLHWAQNGFNGLLPSPGLISSLELQGRSRMWANDANSATALASGYVMANLKLRHRQAWAGGSFESYLGIDNLQNKQAVGSVIVNQSGGGFFEPALPRTWVLGMQARWEL